MANRHSSDSDERLLARSQSRRDSFSGHLLRPWSYDRVSEVSKLSEESDGYPKDIQDGPACLTDDHSQTCKPEGAWARFGNEGREKGLHQSASAWTRSGDVSWDKGDEDKQFATTRGGWWKEQMLVDRSLRVMAGLTSLFAFIMIIICIRYMPELSDHKNTGSTSVGPHSGQDCGTLESTNLFLHLLINIAATLILGMSNTYQQLVTSLDFKEIRWVLSKHGDSRVGTNSPMNIKHKKRGKRKAWLSWLLLILTSVPIHLLANSVFGQSIFVTAPSRVEYISSLEANNTIISNSPDGSSKDWPCWVAFRTGGLPSVTSSYFIEGGSTESMTQYPNYFGVSTVLIHYNEANCTRYQNTTTLSKLNLAQERAPDITYNWRVANCSLANSTTCFTKHPENPKCRISVRISALMTLTVCLIIKAAYMVAVNVASRRSIKSQCLTFGDVIVASSFDKDARIHNECMLNAGDGYRHGVAHTCHKHCKDREPSLTGDSIGHCQKCIKFNTVDKAANLIHPNVAIKYKKSLLSNLGSTALVQMIILMFCSIAMLAVSILLAYEFGSSAVMYKEHCGQNSRSSYGGPCTNSGKIDYLKGHFGTFGGFNSSADIDSSLSSVTNEAVAFFIANGAQVLYSALYLLLIYNLTLISMELDWGQFETKRKQPRCTIVRGSPFSQSYLLQLPKKVLYPMMTFSAVMHWLLGQAISAREIVYADSGPPTKHSEQSLYSIVYGIYSVWFSTILMMAMTATCWWAFTYTREGFMPQCLALFELVVRQRQS